MVYENKDIYNERYFQPAIHFGLNKRFNIGIDIDNEKLAIVLYADDMVLLAENEKDPQKMLDVLNCWCKNNQDYNISGFLNYRISKMHNFGLIDINLQSIIFTPTIKHIQHLLRVFFIFCQ
jgi:hypothetical protein